MTIRVGIAGAEAGAGAEACVGYFAVGVTEAGVGNSERPLVEDIDCLFDINTAVDPVEIFAFRLACS